MTERDLNVMEEDLHATRGGLTVSQHAAIGFTAGVAGALAVVLFSHILFQLGLVVKGPIPFPIQLKSPGIYQPLFWGGLWGILFGLFVKATWKRLYLLGFLYMLAPMLATFSVLPAEGRRGVFRASAGRGDVPALRALREYSVRHRHRLDRQGHHSEALSIDYN